MSRKASNIIASAVPRNRTTSSQAERSYVRDAVAEAKAIGCDVIVGYFCAHESDLLEGLDLPIAYITDITTKQVEDVEIASRL